MQTDKKRKKYDEKWGAKSYKFNLYLNKADEHQIAQMLDNAKKNQGMKKLIIHALKQVNGAINDQ